MSQETEFECKDLVLVTYLRYCGIKFLRPPKKLHNRPVTFYFPRSPELETACSNFIGSEALAVMTLHREMKRMVFETMEEVE